MNRLWIIGGIVVAALGAPTIVNGGQCTGDLNDDGVVNAADLALLLGNWGPCPISCDDGFLNGLETDVDCGGPECPPCADGLNCLSGADCLSGVCQLGVCQTCPTYCLDADRDGFGDPTAPFQTCDAPPPGFVANCDDCDDGCTACLPGGIEVCDGLDNDCNDAVDDGLVQVCGSDVGQCQSGMQVCMDGIFGPCVGEVGPQPEVCDSLDNDCDGIPDNGPAGCDDDNPCTINECSAGACQFSPDDGLPCTDGDACTTDDTCLAGSCEGTLLNCDDGDPCTVDSCDGAGGCDFEPVPCGPSDGCCPPGCGAIDDTDCASS